MSPPCRRAGDHPADQPPTKVRRPPLIPPGRSALGAGPWRAARPPPFPHEQNMTAPTILGIDPGAHGAIAVRDEGGDLLKVLDMPSTPEANGSRQLIDGESKGKNHVISIDPESPRHRGHPAALANKQRHSLAPEVLRERNRRMEERNDLRCRKRST
jgi:hypothetical protein